jgi:hypothetical protein
MMKLDPQKHFPNYPMSSSCNSFDDLMRPQIIVNALPSILVNLTHNSSNNNTHMNRPQTLPQKLKLSSHNGCFEMVKVQQPYNYRVRNCHCWICTASGCTATVNYNSIPCPVHNFQNIHGTRKKKPNLILDKMHWNNGGMGWLTSWPSWQLRLQAVQTPALPAGT